MKLKVVIVGAGIVGCGIARELSIFENLDITVVDKEPDACFGMSKANTGIIHAGYDDNPELYPIRARLCSKGNLLWRKWIRELKIPAIFRGSMVLCFEEGELRILRELIERGKKNNVPCLKLIYDISEIKNIEKNVNDDICGALFAETTGVLSPYKATYALLENATLNGVKFEFRKKVVGVSIRNGMVYGVNLSDGDLIRCDILINSAGLYADEISRMAGIDEIRIIPKKGEYILFERRAEPKVSTVLFPVPQDRHKGVVVLTTVDGNLMIGPNSIEASDKEDRGTSEDSLSVIWKSASRLVHRLPPKTSIIRTFAGIRAETSSGDFLIKGYEDPWGFINVAGIRSPGLTAAPAIASMVKDIIRRQFDIKLVKKSNWKPYNESNSNLPDNGRKRVVCFCEGVTEKEIFLALEKGATTLDGIKFRTRAMMGKCQGSFCRLRIAKILSEWLGKELWEIEVGREGSTIGIGDIKSEIRRKEFEI